MESEQKELALSAIEAYIWDLREPRRKYTKQRFVQLSYSRYAAEELYYYVEKHDDISPIQAVEQFSKLMDEYSCSVKNKEMSFVFSVAYDIAVDVLDILYGLL